MCLCARPANRNPGWAALWDENAHDVLALNQRDIEELSIDEISGVLSLTRENVKARIHRARLMIQEYLIRD